MRRLIAFTLLCLLCALQSEAQDDPWFARDKAMHAAAGAVLGAGGYGAGALVFTGTRARIGVGFGLALGAGAAKELYDRGGRGTPSWRDFAWDGVGAAAGVGVAWLIDHARHSHQPTSPSVRSRTLAPGFQAPPSGASPIRRGAGALLLPVNLDAYRLGEGVAACCSVTR